MCCMQYRSGAELFVRDMALALHRRGHDVILYSPIMGDMVDELRAVCIACVTELALVTAAPDVIIGNTRDETLACMARFLGVPALSICHDRTASHGRPPLFGRIRQYVAVDENCAQRLCLEHGIARSSIRLVSNGVDLARFQPRAPLPDKPVRAAIFSNYSTNHEETATIRAACQAHGIELEVIGSGVDRQARSPEQVLAQYDLVFAKARCAMEAMAIGCAVILFNENMGMAGMVTTANVQAWQPWNFGRRLLQTEVSHANVVDAIANYSAADAKSVSDFVRANLSLDATAHQLESIALHIVEDEPNHPPMAPADEIGEFARHCMDNLLPYGSAHQAVQTGMMQERIEARDAVIAAQQEQLTRLARQLETNAKDARDACSRELVTTINQLYERERHVNALLASRSWRVTAPLRWLAARLGLK